MALLKSTNRRSPLAMPVVTSLAVIAALGISRLPNPLGPDQALFLIGGRAIADGRMPYRDFWDVSPVGIFLYYAAAGSVFGFDEVGVHAFELVSMLLLAASLIGLLRPIYGTRVGCVAAALTIGSYYLIVDEWWMTTPSVLMNAPLFIALVSLARAQQATASTSWWLLLAGLASGIVFVFKPVLFAVPFTFWLCFWMLDTRVGRSRNTWLLLGASAAAPVIAVLVWFAARGALPEFLDTMFVAPGEVARRVDVWSRLPILKSSGKWFAGSVASLIFLSTIQLWRFWRHGFAPADRRTSSRTQTFMTAGLLAWLLAGTATLLVQVWSWWPSHWALLLCPLGILSALALERAPAGPPARRRAFAPGVVVAAIVLAYPLGLRFWDVARGFPRSLAALESADRVPYQAARVPWFQDRKAESAFLARTDSVPGSIFVWGDPFVYLDHYKDRPMASSILAPPMVMTEGLYARMLAELQQRRPVYIYLKHAPNEEAFLERPSLRRFLNDGYEAVHRSSQGTWYALRTSGLRVRPWSSPAS